MIKKRFHFEKKGVTMKLFICELCLAFTLCALSDTSQTATTNLGRISHPIYPAILEQNPDLPSPCSTLDGNEYLVAVTKNDKFAIIDVTLSNQREICRQLVVDSLDFPELAQHGLHSQTSLLQLQTITHRSLEEINRLGRPNGLSQAGFMAEDETIKSVLLGDNALVKQLNLTHPMLATPLFHVLNMMEADLSLGRWNMAKHSWENIKYFYYNERKIFVEAEDTKGGQLSIFNDGIEGGFYIHLWRQLSDAEESFLQTHYSHLTASESDWLREHLTHIHTGEMEPQYIMRYGFYEGHTFWRADPIAIAFIFGIKDLNDLERIFENRLYEKLSRHFSD